MNIFTQNIEHKNICIKAVMLYILNYTHVCPNYINFALTIIHRQVPITILGKVQSIVDIYSPGYMDHEPASVHVGRHGNESTARSCRGSEWTDPGNERRSAKLLQSGNLRNHRVNSDARLSLSCDSAAFDILLPCCELYKYVFHFQKLVGNSVTLVQSGRYSDNRQKEISFVWVDYARKECRGAPI